MNAVFVAFNVVFAAIATLGIIANLTLILIISTKKKHRTSFDISLISFGVADLLCSTSFVFYVAEYFRFGTQAGPSMFGYVSGTMDSFSFLSAFVHVILIAVQRFIAVFFPIRCKRILSKPNIAAALILVWTSALILTILKSKHLISMKSLDFVPLIICFALLFTYGAVYYRISTRKIPGQTNPAQNDQQRKKKRIFIYSLSVVLSFMICILPIRIFVFVGTENAIIEKICAMLLILNPLLDAVLYFIISKFNIIEKCCKRKTNSDSNVGKYDSTLEVSTTV